MSFMRHVATLVLLVLLAAWLLIQVLRAQAPAQPSVEKPTKATNASAATNDVFSGIVMSFENGSLTVVRKVPARADEPRTFTVDETTKIEGKLKVSARVTIRFQTDSSGAFHAERVIVRVDSKVGSGKAQQTAPAR